MKRVTLIATAFVIAVLAVFTARVAAQGGTTQERTFLTFSNTVELPNLTLPAGTYVFRLADTPSRNVVQVLSQDEKEMLGQWTFVPAERPQVSDETVVMFREAREGSNPAVQYWYYPGDRTGKEFIYPKDQAMKIADLTGASVLSDDGRVSSNSTVASTDPQGQATPWPREGSADASASDQIAGGSVTAGQAQSTTTATSEVNPNAGNAVQAVQGDARVNTAPADREGQPTVGVTAAREDAATRGAVGTSGVDAQADVRQESTQARATELPQTASPVPLAGLFGLLSLAGAVGVRRFATVRR